MPTYEYECTACGQRVEVYQRITEDPLTTCGVCGGPLRKVFHPAGIVFKGSGFYATDHRSPPKTSTSAPAGSSPEAKGPSKDAGGSASSAKDAGGSASSAKEPSS